MKPIRSLLALSVLSLAPVVAAAADAPTRLFALVLGTNDTVDPKQTPLQFADDDAARTAELLREMGADVELLTTLDKESQALFSSLVSATKPPTRENILAARDALNVRMAAASAGGAGAAVHTELILYYSGHGNVGPDGNEYLNLSGGTLTRDDLFVELLGASKADFNHLIIDACQSEAFVLSRGGDWQPDRGDVEYTQAVQRYLAERKVSNFPNTGVTLATSADHQTHEWARYRGGIFTHQLLSGLRGAADLNGDGAVEYSELGAFVASANSGVRDPRARLRVVVLPPAADQRHPLLRDVSVAKGRVLLFPPFDDGRYALEDARGVRLADLHRASGQPSYLRLPAGELYLYRDAVDGQTSGEEEGRIPAETAGVIDASTIAYGPTERRSRGALDVAFRAGLFQVAYGPGYYAGYTDQTRMLATEHPEWKVEIWHNGERVSTTTTQALDGDAKAEAHADAHEDDDGPWWGSRWGALAFGTQLGVGAPEQSPDGAARTLSAGDTQPWMGQVRGFEMSWHSFQLSRRDPYPGSDFFFRTGYVQGDTALSAATGSRTPNALSYQSVPLFFGFNGYLFDEFPLRPYAGAAVGLDVMHLRYSFDDAMNRADRTDVSARLGFELHAGLELRMTNHFAVQAEFRQLWSDTRELSGLPDFNQDGLSATLAVQVALPFQDEAPRKGRRKLHVDIGLREDRDDEREDAPTPVPPVPPVPPAPVPSLPDAPPAPVQILPPAPDAPPAPVPILPAAPEAPPPPATP